jgi:uncharacterized protein YjbI with pentapeptide repeats
MPVIIKPSRLGIMTKIEPQKSGGIFVVSALGLFRLHDPSELLSDQALWPMAAKEVPPGSFLDTGSAKIQGEILLGGHASAPNGDPVSAMTVGVAMAGQTIDLAIFGDRYWMPQGGGAVFTEPKPFAVMPIVPDRAFGGGGFSANPVGRGFNASARIVAGEAVLLPNVEYRHDLLRHVDQVSRPALVGPIDLASPERRRLAGTYDNDWLKNYHPGLPPDADLHIYNMAPEEQRIAGYFEPGMPFHAIGMSAQFPDVNSSLPRFRVRCLLERASSPVGLNELQMRIDTAWFIAGEGMGVVIYRGVTPVLDPDALDVKGVLLAYERVDDAPRPTAHYAEIMTARLKREPELKYLLPDVLLSPPPDPAEEARKRRLRESYNRQLVAKFREAQIWFSRKKASEAGIPLSLVPDIPPPDPPPFLLPTPDELARGDVNLAEMIDGVEQYRRETVDRLNPLLEHMTKDPTGLVRNPDAALDALLPADQAQAIKDAIAQAPPSGLAALARTDIPEDVRDRLAQMAEQLPVSFDGPGDDGEGAYQEACDRFATSAGAQLLQGASAALDDPKLAQLPPQEAPDGDARDVLSLLDKVLQERPEAATRKDAIDEGLHRSQVTVGGRAPSLDELLGAVSDFAPQGAPGDATQRIETGLASAQTSLRENRPRLDNGLAQVRQIAPTPMYPPTPLGPGTASRFGAYVLTRFGAGERLAGRDMAGADLSGADLSGIDLTGAFFERANLSGARLARAHCVKAVFAGARLDDADLSGADLSQANFSQTSARGANFRGARMEKFVSLHSDFTAADLSGARLMDANLPFARLTGATLSQATLIKVVFVKGGMDHLKADGADLQECSFVEVSLAASRFTGARLFRNVFLRCRAPGIRMERTDLDQSIFLGGTDLTGGRFSGARGFKTTWQGVVLTGADFGGGSFDRATFGEADLSRASFRLTSLKHSLFGAAKLVGADLFGANLLEAQLRRADLSGAALRSANLYSADLNGSALTAADLSGANTAKTCLMLPANAS